jgi:hypothetical protein
MLLKSHFLDIPFELYPDQGINTDLTACAGKKEMIPDLLYHTLL